MIANQPYHCNLRVFNLSDDEKTRKVTNVMKIPNGSILLGSSENIMIRNNLDFDPGLGLGEITCSFYFPEVGTYTHLPTFLYESGQLIA